MATLSDLAAHYAAYAQRQTFPGDPAELYEPVRYIMSLGGKRLRPLLVLEACRLFGGDPEKALSAAYAVELFHNFSLVHDDIMDRAPLRRGKPTVHEKFGQNTAILAGDVMLVKVYGYLAQGAGHLLPRLLDIFNETAAGVCEGQQMDMLFEDRHEVPLGEYVRMIELKTAVLLSGALEMGALIGGASADDAARLGRFGRNVGIAFQIKDDLLDSFGDPQKFGKKTGGDIAQGKKTFLVCKAMETAPPPQQNELRRLLSMPVEKEEEKIAAVLALFRDLDIPRHAEEGIESYYRAALADLDAVGAPANAKRALAEFAADLMQREH
jgi:geranylgeranyl diphosphate synthase type II